MKPHGRKWFRSVVLGSGLSAMMANNPRLAIRYRKMMKA